MADTPKFERDSDTMPTQELLRRQRKAAYEAAKAKRKQERKDAKVQKQKERAEERAQKDKELWLALRKATDLDEEA